MRYFHRTSVDPDTVLAEADSFFASRLAADGSERRGRTFSGTLGKLTVSVRPEGGHYTMITAVTDQPGESELDKLAKRFLGAVHSKTDKSHVLRGAY